MFLSSSFSYFVSNDGSTLKKLSTFVNLVDGYPSLECLDPFDNLCIRAPPVSPEAAES